MTPTTCPFVGRETHKLLADDAAKPGPPSEHDTACT
jgi:hypothetical protein